VSLTGYIGKQSIGSIKWNEPTEGILSYRYPTHDLKLRRVCQLTVSESQMVAFAGQGRIAGVFGPGQHRLDTRKMPAASSRANGVKSAASPVESDVYFFSTRIWSGRKWGTSDPVVIQDRKFGAVRLRCSGTYSYQLADPRLFFSKICGTRGVYFTEDLEYQLRNTILEHINDGFTNSNVAFLDLAGNQAGLAEKISDGLKPVFAELGLELTQFSVENVSLPEELAKVLDKRIGARAVREKSLRSDVAVDQAHAGSQRPAAVGTMTPSQAAVATISETKFCIDCGHTIPARAKFCLDCGKQQ
jgi:membrane protease subunit (stomatin/prohibitin family)